MVQIIKKISLEVSKPNLIQAIVAKQYDNNSRFLQVTLIHEGKKIEIAPTSTILINAKRIDGTEKPFAGEANDDGTATVPLTYWMLELEGEVWCDVSVIDTEGRKLTSTKFELLVEKASCSNSDITEDENYDVLIKLIEDVNKAKPDLKYDPTSENAQSGFAVAEAFSDVANAIKNTVSGNPIVIDDATPFNHNLDIKATANETVYVRGKNLIPFDNKAYNNGKYVAGQTYEINGVSFTINNDGSVTLKGTSTAPVVIPLIYCSEYKTGIHTVALSGSPEGASATTYCLRLINGAEAISHYEDYGQGKVVNNVDLSGSSVCIVVISGKTIDATFYPMLEFGDTVGEFVPPTDTQSVIADENGVVNGLTSVASEMCIFTETGVTIDCTYNKDTTKAVEEQINSVKDDIEKLGYRLLGTLTTEEDVQMISASQLEDGTTLKSLNIKKVFILFTGSFVNTTSSQPLCVLFNNGSVYQMYKSFNIIADRFYGLWFECEKIISLTDRTVYKSTYPSALLMNFISDTGNAQGLSGNNVELCSDVAVSIIDTISSMKFGCFNSNNLIKAGSTIYLFGV